MTGSECSEAKLKIELHPNDSPGHRIFRTWSQGGGPDGKAYTRGSRRAPHGLGSSGPRSAAGRSGIYLPSLRREKPEEGPTRADRIKVYRRLSAGCGGRRRAVPFVQAVAADSAGGDAARSG